MTMINHIFVAASALSRLGYSYADIVCLVGVYVHDARSAARLADVAVKRMGNKFPKQADIKRAYQLLNDASLLALNELSKNHVPARGNTRGYAGILDMEPLKHTNNKKEKNNENMWERTKKFVRSHVMINLLTFGLKVLQMVNDAKTSMELKTTKAKMNEMEATIAQLETQSLDPNILAESISNLLNDGKLKNIETRIAKLVLSTINQV
jgi:hypothetical protein